MLCYTEEMENSVTSTNFNILYSSITEEKVVGLATSLVKYEILLFSSFIVWKRVDPLTLNYHKNPQCCIPNLQYDQWNYLRTFHWGGERIWLETYILNNIYNWPLKSFLKIWGKVFKNNIQMMHTNKNLTKLSYLHTSHN